MKNTFLLPLFLLPWSLCVAQQQPQPQPFKPVTLNKISENLYEILEGKGARGGVYIGDNGVLVIDAKQDEISVKQTIEEIGKITPKPIKYLVNTHSDGDHVFGNQFFPNTVTIISQEICRQEFFLPKKDGSPSDWNKPALLQYMPSITFRDEMDIYLGSKKVELWYFGIGHTSGDAVVYIPEVKTAFLGDQVFVGRAQLIHTPKGGNSFEHVKTLTRMLQTLNAERFCSGHSEILNRSEVQNHIDEMKSLQDKIISLIDLSKPLEDIKNEFDKKQGALVETIYNEIKNKKT